MGTVTLSSGVSMVVEEVDGVATLQQLYEDAANEHYTEKYRVRTIKAWGKLKRSGWQILPLLHDLVNNGGNDQIVAAAKEAIKAIDPGAPAISKDVASTYAPTSRTTSTSSKPITSAPKVEDRFPVQSGHATVWKKPEKKKVTFTEVIVENGDLSGGTRVSGCCSFCEKQTVFPDMLQQANKAIAGPKKLFCNFCLRNEFYKLRHRQHTLLMSFRGVIAYYYYCFHLLPKNSTMYMMDLESYINLHVRVGTQNPLFRYDPESFLWFVDFSKVGSKPNQMPLSYVLKTVGEILMSFDLYNNVKECSPAALFQKYKEALTDFQHHRRRPNQNRILTPTLYGTGIPHETSLTKAIPINFIKNFTAQQMIDNFKAKKNQGCYT